jgi:dihydroxyacetone kinase-like protein
MIDAWTPALAALDAALASGSPLPDAAAEAAKGAAAGAEATVPMQARKGRASYLGPRSVGHQDPGATSTTMLFAALAKAAAG